MGCGCVLGQFHCDLMLSDVQELKTFKEETKHQLKATYAAVRSSNNGSSQAGVLAEEAKSAAQVLGSDGLLRVCDTCVFADCNFFFPQMSHQNVLCGCRRMDVLFSWSFVCITSI